MHGWWMVILSLPTCPNNSGKWFSPWKNICFPAVSILLPLLTVIMFTDVVPHNVGQHISHSFVYSHNTRTDLLCEITAKVCYYSDCFWPDLASLFFSCSSSRMFIIRDRIICSLFTFITCSHLMVYYLLEVYFRQYSWCTMFIASLQCFGNWVQGSCLN